MKTKNSDVDFKISDDKILSRDQLPLWQKVLYILCVFIIIGCFAMIVIQRGQIKNLKDHQKECENLKRKFSKLQNEKKQISKQLMEIKKEKKKIFQDKISSEQGRAKSEDEKSFLIGCEGGDKGRILYYLDKGVDIDVREEQTGKTGLHYAVEGFYTEIIKILLNKGANPNLRDKDGYTPILLSAKPTKDNNMFLGDSNELTLIRAEIIELLLKAGAHLNDQTESEGLNLLGIYILYSPENFRYALGNEPFKFRKEFVEYLLNKGIDINAKTPSDFNWYDRSTMNKKKYFIPKGSTLLDIVAARNDQRTIVFLKQHGAEHGIWAKYYLGKKGENK